jgi:glycosyltransferase involved in cell wall biosynthesis
MNLSHSILIANPSTAEYVQASARGYFQEGMLDVYFTTFMSHPDYPLSSSLLKLMPKLEPELSRRKVKGLPIEVIRNFPFPEIFRTVSSRYLDPKTTDFVWEWAETLFDKKAGSLLKRERHRLVHVYEHAALATLKRAKSLQIASIYEQPSIHHSYFQPIIEKQLRLFPELRTGAVTLLNDEKAKRRNQRRDEELQLADFIRCNSSFTKRTLIAAGAPESKISVLPHGFPKPIDFQRKESGNKLIFLNAGTQSLGKASHLLYEAWRQCNFTPEEAELWLIGKMTLPERLRRDLPGKVVIRDSIPRDQLLDIYSQADVFILPTLADGFGMVVSESMSRGVPVIATENSGAPDIILQDYNGMIIPAGDLDALVAKMRWCLANKHLLPEMGLRAWEKAKSWQMEDFEKAVAAFAKEKLLEIDHAR